MKFIALSILCAVNAFCILYSLAYVSLRDNGFQYSLIKVTIMQYAFEILYHETCTCVFVQIVIPLLISDEVKKSCQIYRYIMGGKLNNHLPDDFNMNQFIHVSHMIASQYPQSTGKFYLFMRSQNLTCNLI